MVTLGFKKKVKPLLKTIQSWIQLSRAFKSVTLGDTLEIILNILTYQKIHGDNPFAKEYLERVKAFYPKIKEEYYDDTILEDELEKGVWD